MRAALTESIGRQPEHEYPKGSIIVCISCGRPLYRLERGIAYGEKAGRARDALRPVTVTDLVELRQRVDLESGVRALLHELSSSFLAYVDAIPLPTQGSPALCCFCGQAYVVARSAETSDTID